MTRTKIAHLSDLHFCGRGDKHLDAWKSARAFIAEQRPEIVVVTGDLAENPWRLSVAREHLAKLSRDLDLPVFLSPALASPAPDVGLQGEDIAGPKSERGMILVPGNHDVRWLGNCLQTRHFWKRHFGNPSERGVWFRHRNIVV